MTEIRDFRAWGSIKSPSRVEARSHSLGVSWPDFRGWSGQVKSTAGLSLFQFNIDNVSDKSGLPTRYNVSSISADTFSTIGQKPIMGRDFTTEDEKAGATPVVNLG